MWKKEKVHNSFNKIFNKQLLLRPTSDGLDFLCIIKDDNDALTMNFEFKNIKQYKNIKEIRVWIQFCLWI